MPPAARRRDSPHARPWLILVVAALAALRLLVRFVLRRRVRKARAPVVAVIGARARSRSRRMPQGAVAFFHPFTNDGGGGERVLWCAPRAWQTLARRCCCCCFSRAAARQVCRACDPSRSTARPGAAAAWPWPLVCAHVLKMRNCVRSTSTLATPRPLQSWQSARTRSSACRRCVRWRAFGCGAAALSWRRCTR